VFKYYNFLYALFAFSLIILNPNYGAAKFDLSKNSETPHASRTCIIDKVEEGTWKKFQKTARPSSKQNRPQSSIAYRTCQKNTIRQASQTPRYGKLTIIEQQNIGLIETGLRPRFPTNVDCEGISSPFGSRTRYDGSARVSRSNNGYHGGMDISLKIGTPLLAAADGRLIHKGTGGRLTGHVIWIQHSPKDTGLGLWTYTKYQHLNKLPDMAIGTRLKMGDIVGTSGNTGTTGGYFKQFGYPHLHMNVYSSTNNKYRTRKHKVKIKNRGYVDPVAFYRNGAINSHQVRILSKREKIINIGVKLLSGKIIPENSKRIWPVNCKMNEE
jgi:murein DD-endopeptidase MepM/ murein hydrolase activator NlpD